jgi:nicotinamidase-related amidase
LDLQLRRRGIDTIVLCEIATNIGVESTAREALQLGYQQIFITGAMTSMSEEEHEPSLRFIFPRIGKSRTTDEFLMEIQNGSFDASSYFFTYKRTLAIKNCTSNC